MLNSKSPFISFVNCAFVFLGCFASEITMYVKNYIIRWQHMKDSILWTPWSLKIDSFSIILHPCLHYSCLLTSFCMPASEKHQFFFDLLNCPNFCTLKDNWRHQGLLQLSQLCVPIISITKFLDDRRLYQSISC